VSAAPAFASALSRHADAAEATAEVVGEMLETVGAAPDAAVLFVSGAHAASASDIVGAVGKLLRPGCLVGSTAPSVLAGRLEIEHQAAVALWAGRIDGVRTVRFDASRTVSPIDSGDVGPEELAEAHSLVLIADPVTFDVAMFLDDMATRHAGITVLGGLAAGAGGQTRAPAELVVDDAVVAGGAVGLLLSGATTMTSAVSQGCRPIGQPWVVTGSDGHLIHELAGRPATERLQQVLAGLDDTDQDRARGGLHMGRVVDEHREVFGPGDFLIRAVLGIDRDTGGLVVGDTVPVGSTVQLQVRDASSAHHELVNLLDGHGGTDAALLFTCTGRGTHLFDRPHHDADTIGDALGDVPLAGMFCAGEIGPVGDRSFLHGFTASVALFGH